MTGIAFFLVVFVIYFLPAMVAFQNKKRNVNAITVLNIFAGWTIIGWVAALIWAATKEK